MCVSVVFDCGFFPPEREYISDYFGPNLELFLHTLSVKETTSFVPNTCRGIKMFSFFF